MIGSVVNIVIFSLLFLAASAYKLSEDDYKVADIIKAQLKGSPEEAIFVGHILREAAREISQSHGEDDKLEEYSWRGFWQKVQLALITAAQKVKAFFVKVGKVIFESVKEVAISAAEAALEAAKEKALQKAIEIVDKLVEKSVASYSTENHAPFARHFCERMDLIGKRLIEEGEKLRSQ